VCAFLDPGPDLDHPLTLVTCRHRCPNHDILRSDPSMRVRVRVRVMVRVRVRVLVRGEGEGEG
jgi:hypothetical protein